MAILVKIVSCKMQSVTMSIPKYSSYLAENVVNLAAVGAHTMGYNFYPSEIFLNETLIQW